MTRRHPARLTAVSAILAAATAAAGLAAGQAGAAQPPARAARAASTAGTAGAARPGQPACAVPRPHRAQCYLRFRPQAAVNGAIAAGRAGPATAPRGWTPQQLRAAYRLPAGHRTARRQTVAVSIAFRTPHLARNLAAYRRHFGLPPCTVASSCFRVVNQRGRRAPLPPSGRGTGWDLEATLDVSMISAACPHCRILVVEASDDGTASLARTDVTAARLGAQVISNSYGTRESGLALALRRSYTPAHHTVVASAGDTGFTAASFPADLSGVIAVGGTSLVRSAGQRGWTERAWHNSSGAGGSGCSAYVRKPRWQHHPHCPGRTVTDVSAVAVRVPVFEPDYGGWVTVAGTSISAPLIAGVYGLAGNAARIGPRHLYTHAGDLFDVTAGNNALLAPPGQACGGDYLCVARPGYDAPTGLGTPDGTAGF
jgi:hypothetical protein